MDSCVTVGYFAVLKAEVENRRNSLLERFGDACYFFSSWFERLGAPSPFLRQALGELFTLMYNPFPAERALRAQAARDLWNSIFSVRKDEIDILKRDKEIERYTSTKKLLLLLEFMKDNVDQVSAGKRRAALHVWLV